MGRLVTSRNCIYRHGLESLCRYFFDLIPLSIKENSPSGLVDFGLTVFLGALWRFLDDLGGSDAHRCGNQSTETKGQIIQGH